MKEVISSAFADELSKIAGPISFFADNIRQGLKLNKAFRDAIREMSPEEIKKLIKKGRLPVHMKGMPRR